jgi:hypothetical protein
LRAWLAVLKQLAATCQYTQAGAIRKLGQTLVVCSVLLPVATLVSACRWRCVR